MASNYWVFLYFISFPIRFVYPPPPFFKKNTKYCNFTSALQNPKENMGLKHLCGRNFFHERKTFFHKSNHFQNRLCGQQSIYRIVVKLIEFTSLITIDILAKSELLPSCYNMIIWVRHRHAQGQGHIHLISKKNSQTEN